MADRTESSTVIAAEPAAVLDVIADFDSYPEWASEFKAGKVKQVVVISAGDDGWADQVEFTLAGATKETYVLAYEWDAAEDGTGVVSWSLVRAPVRAKPGRPSRLLPGHFRINQSTNRKSDRP